MQSFKTDDKLGSFKHLWCQNDLSIEKKLYCIYVALGQKRSTVAQLVKRLTDAGKFITVAVQHNLTHSYPQRLRSIWPGPWIETSGQLQSVLFTDWSDANTMKNVTPEEKLHYETWRKRHQQSKFLQQCAFAVLAKEIL